MELKSEEAKGKLEDALGMVDEKRKRKEELSTVYCAVPVEFCEHGTVIQHDGDE